MEKIKVSFEESAFIVEVEGKKLRVSYKQAELPFKKAQEFCKENGGGDETVENLRLLSKYRDQINEQLRKNGRTELSGWYWANEESWRYNECAFVVSTNDGNVYVNGMNYTYTVRAVSAL
ncbi:MAG: hypothetical protein IIW52_05205 [Alistipes sp.]|nr:hypothetical protein [Alistipes sp.]